jgi:hypothetical protein
MDDDFQSLEKELQQLRPAPLSPRLVAQVEVELAGRTSGAALFKCRPGATPAARAPIFRHWWWAVTLPAAAAIALVWSLRSPTATPSGAEGAAVATVVPATEEGGLKPVAAENVLVAARDEGVVTLDDGTAARRERLQFVDTITWKNPRTNASLRWSIPREEVRVVPIVFQ